MVDHFAKFEIDTAGCWIWTGAPDSSGYGRLRLGARMVKAHRWIYEQAVGPIPLGLELDHLCHVRRCVNPDHLEPVTHAENMRRSLPALSDSCVNGHEYSPENTRLTNGTRSCRTCNRLAVARYQQKRRGQSGAVA